ncbi:MAG TPA: hypothetical protein VE056_05960, partial [Pyrinomonadaceae bacterium]|nr:hypothetical protein [Pyrinomonadaceae bacterium]
MRRSFLVILLLVVTVFFVAQTASAQLIKIPKIPKPKPQPTPTEPTQPAPTTDSESEQPATRPTSGSASSRAGGPYAVQPEPPMTTPQFLPETLEVQVQHWDYYWKIPNDNHNTSWAPRLKFDVVYGGSTKLRLKVDYFM